MSSPERREDKPLALTEGEPWLLFVGASLLPLFAIIPLVLVKTREFDGQHAVMILLSLGFVACCVGIFNILAGRRFESRRTWFGLFLFGAAFDLVLVWIGVGVTLVTALEAAVILKERRRQELAQAASRVELVAPSMPERAAVLPQEHEVAER